MRKLAIVLAILIILVLSMLPRACDAAGPDAPGSGAPPASSHVGVSVDNNSPSGLEDTNDWNNGCQPDHHWDVHNGHCVYDGPPREEPVTQKPTVHHNCTVRIYGRTPEVFEGDVDVRDPRSERFVLAEANGFLEFHGTDGESYQVLWWDPFWGHKDSAVTEFVCEGVITLYEPPLRPRFSPPQLKWR